jgi:N-acetylglutamate synthase-like GNAT family acetyltransferase
MLPSPSLTNMRCRRYRSADRNACIGLFDSNVPDSFTAAEREAFTSFVDASKGPYLVVEDHAGTVIGCGGLAKREGAVDLCWGLVGRRYHRRGVGRFLLRVRLAIASALPGVAEVQMNTSNETAPFFEREGFETTGVTENFFRSGLHKHDMRLALTDDMRRTIRRKLEETLEAGHLIEAEILRAT